MAAETPAPPQRRMVDRRTVLAGLAAAPIAARASEAYERRGAFVALGDWGRYGGAQQRAVATGLADAAAELSSKFVVAVGDNFYPAGVASVRDPHWTQSFEDVYAAPSLQTPWYAALGNHDYRGRPHAQVAYSRLSARWRMPSRYYRVASHELGIPGLDLFVIDTAAMVQGARETVAQAINGHVRVKRHHHHRGRQLGWLDAELARSDAPLKIVVGHHPIYSGTHGDEPLLAERLAPLLERHGVRAYVYGHDHDLQHVRRGTVEHVCSGAGSDARRTAAIEGTRFCAGQLGFAAFLVESERLQLQFRDPRGRELYRADLGQAA